jgi:hypothetical protein
VEVQPSVSSPTLCVIGNGFCYTAATRRSWFATPHPTPPDTNEVLVPPIPFCGPVSFTLSLKSDTGSGLVFG